MPVPGPDTLTQRVPGSHVNRASGSRSHPRDGGRWLRLCSGLRGLGRTLGSPGPPPALRAVHSQGCLLRGDSRLPTPKEPRTLGVSDEGHRAG